LLPRLLVRRQRLHPGAADARADVEEGKVAPRAAAAAPRALFHLGRDQHEAVEYERRTEEAAGDRRTVQGCPARQDGRHLGRLPRLALQRARLQHRAAPAAEPRGGDGGDDGEEAGRGLIYYSRLISRAALTNRVFTSHGGTETRRLR